MHTEQLVASFAAFAAEKNVDRPTVMHILEDVFRAMIRKKFETDEHFDLIINLEQGDLQIWRFRNIVSDEEARLHPTPGTIGVTEAQKIEPDFEEGEEVAEEIPLSAFGRRAVLAAKTALLQKVKDLDRDNLCQKYASMVGELVHMEVHQILPREVILVDAEGSELIMPKNEQIPKDRFRKGEVVKAVVQRVELDRATPRVVLSRTSPAFLERLLEQEVPEIDEGVITIKRIVREPGERAKVAVESSDDRIDPVGACVGVRGARIHAIVRELQHENIDVINFTDNFELYVARALSPAKVSSMKQYAGRIAVYLQADQVSLAIGKGGQNIRLASRLLEREIDVYRELGDEQEDVDLREFTDEIDVWVIDALRAVGLDTARSVLDMRQADLEQRVDLEQETIEHLYEVLKKELEG